MRGFRGCIELRDSALQTLPVTTQLSFESDLRVFPDSSSWPFAMKVTVRRFSASSSFRNLTNLTFVLLLIGLISHCRVHSLATKNFVVFGASGKTGALIVKRLLSENIEGRKIICPVRNLAKARAILGPESKFLSLLPCDLERDGNEKVIDIVNNADAVVISSAYSPGTFYQRSMFVLFL